MKLCNGVREIFKLVMKKWAKSILKTLLNISVVTLVLLAVLFYALKNYTNHGDVIFVPDLTELSVDEARKMTEKHTLRMVVIDSVYIKGETSVKIVEQREKAGSKVKENRRIHVIKNTLTPEMVDMPSVVSISLRQARSVLQNKGLKVRRLEYVSDIAANFVLAQKYNGREIARDEKIAKDSQIDLVLGSGNGSTLTNIPDLKNLNENNAKEKLIDQFLNLGRIFYDQSIQSDQDKRYGKVWRQEPMPDTTANFGTPVNIWITVDKSVLNEKENNIE